LAVGFNGSATEQSAENFGSRHRLTNVKAISIPPRALFDSFTAPELRNRQAFQRNQLTELANTDFESWAKESFEIATKIAYRNGGRIGIPKSGNCGDGCSGSRASCWLRC
jgi:hypothetical protein